jgi:hypothetical protein
LGTFKGTDIRWVRRYGDCMEVAPRFQSPRWWPWAVAILLVIVVNLAFFGYQRGECIDYTVESGAVSTCSSGPVLGIYGTWLLAVVSVAAIVYFTRRLVHVARARTEILRRRTGRS